MARTSRTRTPPPIVLAKHLTAFLRCSMAPSAAVRRNGRTRGPAGQSQHPTRGATATTNINRPNSLEVTDRKDVQPSFFSVASRFEEPTIIREERMMTNTANGICITQVATVFVPVADQKRALVFYLDKLGFEKRADFSYAEGSRWIEVAPPGSAIAIALVPPSEGKPSGGDETHCAFTTDDIEADHATLRSTGVDVDAEIARKGKCRTGLVSVEVTIPDALPPHFFFRDPDGNRFLIVEPV